MEVDEVYQADNESFDSDASINLELNDTHIDTNSIPLSTAIQHVKQVLIYMGINDDINFESNNKEDVAKIVNLVYKLFKTLQTNDETIAQLRNTIDTLTNENCRLKNDKIGLDKTITTLNSIVDEFKEKYQISERKNQKLVTESEQKLKDLYAQYVSLQHKDIQYQAFLKKKDLDYQLIQERLDKLISKSNNSSINNNNNNNNKGRNINSNIYFTSNVKNTIPLDNRSVMLASAVLRSKKDQNTISNGVTSQTDSLSASDGLKNIETMSSEDLQLLLQDIRELYNKINESQIIQDQNIKNENEQIRIELQQLQKSMRSMMEKQNNLVHRYDLTPINTPVKSSQESYISPVNFTPYIGNAPFSTIQNDIIDSYNSRLEKFNKQFDQLKALKDVKTVDELNRFLEEARDIIRNQNDIIQQNISNEPVKFLDFENIENEKINNNNNDNDNNTNNNNDNNMNSNTTQNNNMNYQYADLSFQ